jgi:complement component 1 Q subcomponent-binding protein
MWVLAYASVGVSACDGEHGVYARSQVFSQLDDKLQQAFVDYLAERGITAELGRYIIEYSADKEQREYMHWLEGVHTFLKA